MKKKYSVSSKNKKDWIDFTRQMREISVKESDSPKQNIQINKTRKLDLHGLTLIEANKIVEKFIIESFNIGSKKLLIVTGKGSKLKDYNNPYISEKFSLLKYSVPEFINNSKNLNNIIHRIAEADLRDGGEGAFYIFLKKNKSIV